ncbi:hypothetical protein CC86DRAFT_410755 [Ophiobolus disseminans]|uniref:Uncharacterized protein n=1 Tax=Ophiobolus disseminans TaxID=1469910 RepID=A0A6A6ZLX2_9PLEO|nr:hypothetical protein CC86DRAFT_410755 [Ophiobolus disseminans]
MKFSILTLTLLAASSSVNAYWFHPKPTPTRIGYPTPTPTPSGRPQHPKPDHPKPKHKQCVKMCFKEAPKCAAGYTPTVTKHGKCNTCCKEAGGKEYKRNMGQAMAEFE